MAGKNGNLIPLSERSPEEKKAIQSAGGKASGRNKRRRKAMKDIVKLFGSNHAPSDITARLIQAGLLEQGYECSMDEALILSQYSKALAGNTKAAEFLRDTSGQKPRDEIEVSVNDSEKFDDIVSQLGGKGLQEED